MAAGEGHSMGRVMGVGFGGVGVSYADSGPINPHSMMSTLHMTYGGPAEAAS